MKWIPSLFAAEAIPSAMITFVALLMFVQLDVGWGMSTLLCGLLTLPWILKSFLRDKVRRMGHFQHVLRFVELAIFMVLVALAFCFGDRPNTPYRIFAVLFVLCLLCAWHELAARMYYERMLRPREQRFYNSMKMSFSQASTVVTYGLLLMVVGALEVFYHNRRYAIAFSWSTAVYMLAGFYLLLVLYNIFVLRAPHVSDAPQRNSFTGAVLAEMRLIDRIFHQRHWLLAIVCLFMLLLPQALMFHSRVLFLLAPSTEGGLGCSLQWIALAQGTVGVIAFSAGLGLGYRLERKKKVFSSIATAQVTLLLSPFVYYAMTQWPPQHLDLLCVATFVAQFTFGFGLNACIPYVRSISGNRYRNTINFLYIPVIALVMLVPVSASGWLVQRLGFESFFILDASLTLPAFLAGYWGFRVLNAKRRVDLDER